MISKKRLDKFNENLFKVYNVKLSIMMSRKLYMMSRKFEIMNIFIEQKILKTFEIFHFTFFVSQTLFVIYSFQCR